MAVWRLIQGFLEAVSKLPEASENGNDPESPRRHNFAGSKIGRASGMARIKVLKKRGSWIQTENTWRSWRLGGSRELNRNFLDRG
jgi:hypothetical protein